MSDVLLSVGTSLFVSAASPATYDTAGFAALSYTEVGEVESLGEFGGSAQITPFTPLATGIVKKRKGSINYGTASASIGRLASDAGQAILKDGFDGANKYVVHSFKVVNSDGAIAYFTGMISSFVTVTNDANNVTKVNCNIELDNKVISDVYGSLFTVSYVAGANGSIIGDTSQRIASGEDGDAVFAAAASGYVFSQWNDASTDNPRTDTNVLANATYTATFVLV